MTRKEFVKKYNIEVDYKSKAWRVMGELQKLGNDLTLENYYSELITDRDIALLSGFSHVTIASYRKQSVRSDFVYNALKEKTVKVFIEKLLKG